MPELPPNPTRDDILAAMDAVPESDVATQQELMRRFAAAPPRPGIKMRHGGRPGEVEHYEGGRWTAMKTMIVALAVCALALGSIPAAAQNSNSCLGTAEKELRTNSDGTTSYVIYFTNNCSWEIKVFWRSNEFGRSVCGKLNNVRRLDPGETSRGSPAYNVNGALEYVGCAEATDRDHPHYNTCPTHNNC